MPDLTPLRRKPKALAASPDLFVPGAKPTGRLEEVEDTTGDLDGLLGAPTSAMSRRVSSERDLAELLENEYVDPDAAALAKQLARRMSATWRRRRADCESTTGRLRSVPYRHGSSEIDVDRTLDVLVERRPLQERDIIVRERLGSRRATALIVDVSGSMRGEKMLMTAAAVGAMSAEFDRRSEEFAVIAFWSEAAVLKSFAGSVGDGVVLDRLLRIPARGLTNIEFAFRVANDQLSQSSAPRRDAIVLTDAMHNAGGDPRLVARSLPRLHVLLETDGEHDEGLAREMANLGRGGLARVASHRDVGPALSRLLGD
ncbi:VWA domain-containing protein [Aeromicrobium sp. A1-2]|uniref:vWA domain-containing protein n=1 Tax=Aeromicrobium sp. A1-2 TaxID=2107713 RepID=UPI000E5432C6|nr:vWA domain-containing protein [Aeromicrobium sp. A1-2]AXT84252.1 VWA domain-containing protein [Aeromicrobium sp. A1-2]